MSRRPKSERRYAARIAGVFGLRGELKCDPTSAGRTAFKSGATFSSCFGDECEEVSIAQMRSQGDRLIVRFKGVEDADAAQRFVGAELYAERSSFKLAEGEFFDEDLVGCVLFGRAGEKLATVTGVEHYAQDILVCGTARIPMVKAFIRDVDIANKRITVELPEGLL